VRSYSLGRRLRVPSSLALLTAALDGCGEPGGPPPEVLVPEVLVMVSGDAQEAEVGTRLRAPIAVRVTDSLGRSVVRARVTFSFLGSTPPEPARGVIEPSTAESDDLGVARAEWTLSTSVGQQWVMASIGPSTGEPTASVFFNAIARPGAPVSIERGTDSIIAITVGDSVTVPDVAKDRYGNPTSRGFTWQVHDPAVATVTSAGSTPVVHARARGTTGLQAHEPTLGSLVFELRTYVGPGRDVAFASLTDELRHIPGIFLLSADGSSLTLLTRQYAADPAWSPDGRRIAFSARVGEGSSAIYVMNADGSGVRALTDTAAVGPAAQPAWSPDGQKIAFVARAQAPDEPPLSYPVWHALYVMNADGTAPRRIVLPNPVLCRTGVCRGAQRPAWSPDGTRIAYAFRTTTFSRSAFGGIFVVNADGSNLRQLPTGDPSTTFASEPAWAPDGERIVFARASMRFAPVQISFPDLYAIGVDGTGLTRFGAPDGARLGATSPAWTPGEGLAFGQTPRWNLGDYQNTWATADLFVANAEGREARRVANPPGGVSRPAWRPGP
jgi:Tol biopolymer transport system component